MEEGERRMEVEASDLLTLRLGSLWIMRSGLVGKGKSG